MLSSETAKDRDAKRRMTQRQRKSYRSRVKEKKRGRKIF